MTIINVLIPVFLTMGIGALTVFFKVFKSEDSAVFSKYNFYVGLPVLIFYSLLHTDFQKINQLPFLGTIVLSFFFTILLMFLVIRIFRFPRKFFGILLLGAIYGNVAYMGIPINELLYGRDGVGYASVIVGIVSALALSLGIFFIEYYADSRSKLKHVLWDMIKNPNIIAVFLGLAASAFAIELWLPIDSTLSLVSKSASPLALFSIGLFLVRKHAMKNKDMIIILCVFNLMLLPIITYFVAKWLGFSGMAFEVSLIEAAMPLASTNFILAQRYKVGEEMMANAIIFSTILSVVTMGVLIMLLQ